MKLLKNIIRVTFANIANFGSSFIVGFILPTVLTVAAYGYYREYTLYLSFVYMFNIGFNDGIYIKYGGVHPDEVDEEEILGEHNFITIFQFIVMLIMIVVSVILKDPILVLFSIVSFFLLLITFHQHFSQATGNFKTFSVGNILKSAIYVATLLFAIFVLQSENYLVYISMSVLSHVLVYAYYEWSFLKKYSFKKVMDFSGKLDIFKVGFFILIANMSLTFVGNVGNLVVNFNYGVEDFAQYSFQNSVLNLILLIVNAVGMVFYNVISKKENQAMLKLTKRILIFLGILGGLGFFVFKLIIETYLTQYIPAISILAMTFVSIPYLLVAKVIIANLYKSRKNERKYLKDVGLFAVFAFAIVYVTYLITNSLAAIAFATTVSYMLWFLYTTRIEYRYLKSTPKEYILLISHALFFIYTATQLGLFTGISVYLIYILIVIFFYKNQFVEIYQFLIKTK